MYDLGDQLLMVASDRISAYDVVLPTPIPDKGKVLTGLSVFWFGRTEDIVPNHLISTDVPEEARGRGLLVAQARDLPGRVRGAGLPVRLGLEGVQQSQAVCGIDLPAGLRESDRLPEPIFTPATKAELGDHDENVDFDRAAEIVGDRATMEELRRLSLEVYARGAEHAESKGIILADTKFEFGRDAGRPHRARGRGADAGLVALLAGRPVRARPRPAVLRQAVRARLGRRDRLGPLAARARSFRAEVVEATRAKYVEAYERIAGEPFERWLGNTA